jgi:3-dehydroquinate synthase
VSGTSTTLRVSLGSRSYDILVGHGILDELPEFLEARSRGEHVVLITDENVDTLIADGVGDQLSENGWEVDLLVVPAGEQSKSVEVVDELWNAMLEHGTDRQSIVLAVGGGVIGDLAGFAAAAFARGIDFFQVPTTLLAQVDSSVGGKVGVNLPEAKNMIGAFWQPRGVLIDVSVLHSLPEREYRAGLAEVVKYGMILDAEFFAYLETHASQINHRDREILAHVVHHCCQLKARVVEQDECETSGLRAVLNYGHTFAHAFEAAGDYQQWLHGEAVAAGMRCAARLAARLGRIDQALVERQDALLENLGLALDPPPTDPQELVRRMYRDKKVAAGRLRFVLPSQLGAVELVDDISDAEVIAALQ